MRFYGVKEEQEKLDYKAELDHVMDQLLRERQLYADSKVKFEQEAQQTRLNDMQKLREQQESENKAFQEKDEAFKRLQEEEKIRRNARNKYFCWI